jgi:hypothetical protein
VRVIPDDSPATAVLSVIKVLTPSGKVGFVPLDSVLPVGGEQMCYVKEPSGWKIAGFLGGEAQNERLPRAPRSRIEIRFA